MSLVDILPWRKRSRLGSTRWQPAAGQRGVRNDREARQLGRLCQSTVEPLEERRLFAVQALIESGGTDSFSVNPNDSGSLVANQFDETGGRVLLGVKVEWELSMENSFDGTFENQSNTSGTASVTLTGDAALSVPGEAVDPETVTVSSSDSAAFVAFETVPLSGSDSDTASNSLFLTRAQADVAGYLGTGTVLFDWETSADLDQDLDGGGAGDFDLVFLTTTEGEVNVTYYYYIPAEISGIKFEDVDGNGTQDGGDAALAGWTINLTGTAEDITDENGNVLLAGGAVSDSDVTDGTGAYSFANLGPGSYTIEEVQQAGWQQTAPVGGSFSVVVDVNGVATTGSLTGNDFGNQRLEPEIELKKYANGVDTDCVDVGVGDTVTYTYFVTNTGAVDLDNVVLEDDNATPANAADDFFPDPILDGGFNVGDLDDDNILDVGETWEYTYDITAIAGEHRNIAVVTADSVIDDTQVTDDDDACYETPPGGEGLTPGFWKQNATFVSKKTGLAPAWAATGYSPNQTLASVGFVGPNFSNITLLQALSNGGGGVKALMRHAVAGILNAAHPEIDYPLTVAQIIAQVNAAIASGNAQTIEDLKNDLDGFNNLGANVNQHGQTT